MVVIGLCGGTGSGKSTVATIFQTYGVEILDADAIYREITSYMSDCLIALRDAFGDEIVLNDSLNRSVLRSLVFEGKNAVYNRNLLNSISHKYVKEEMMARISSLEKQGKSTVLLDVPLLFESNIDKICDFLVCVTAPLEMRIDRLLLRDKITREKAISRIDAQLSDEFLISHTHFHILNDKSLSDTENQVEEIINKIRYKVGT